jgi:hypothetical protein
VQGLTEVRVDIEPKCLLRAITGSGLTWEAAIVAARHELVRTPYDINDLSEK